MGKTPVARMQMSARLGSRRHNADAADAADAAEAAGASGIVECFPAGFHINIGNNNDT